MTIGQSAWTGMVPVDDTALHVSDTAGRGRPMVYLNGAYADQSHWRRVITDLGSDYQQNPAIRHWAARHALSRSTGCQG
jgi:hypothetical protein